MNTVKSTSKISQKDTSKPIDADFNKIITTFVSVAKICESLITDSINSNDPKINYTSLTDIFNRINNAVSFNTFINNIFSYTPWDEKLKDDKEVEKDEEDGNYYKALLYTNGKHPFLIKSDNINMKIDNIYHNLNDFIILCYEYIVTHDLTSPSNKLHKLPIQDTNNYITKTNALLKVKIPYLLKNSKVSKKKPIEDSIKPINIEHNVKKSRDTKIKMVSHDQIKYNYNTESTDIKKNKKTKKTKKQTLTSDNESVNSKSKYSDLDSVSSNKSNNRRKISINDSGSDDSDSDNDNNNDTCNQSDSN